METAEYACVFVRLPRERLEAAQRLVAALPSFLPGALGECDLHHCGASGHLAAVLRAPSAAFSAEAVARLAFWSARAGARGFLVASLPEADASRFGAELTLCEKVARGAPFDRLGELAARFFRELGVPAGAPPGARPVLAVDLDGPGSEGLRYRPENRTLFVAGVLAPPRGDELALAVSDRKAAKPVEGWATVVEVRGRESAAPGRPAGFTLRIEGPSALHELLAQRARAKPGRDGRAAPRFPVKAPVKVTPTAAAATTAAVAPVPAVASPAPPPPPHACVEYATDQELAADWIENLSHGGAFVKTARPLPEGQEVVLDLALPGGEKLHAKAAVAFVSPKGMGLQFALDEEQDALLAAAIARISARRRRALVVDDDPFQQRMLADALAARGFEVIVAGDGESGLRSLSEELLALDLLVTDICMPGMDGEQFIRIIRTAGGEADLAIVAVTAFLEPGLERRLVACGADAVLEKALGAEMIAQAADAALERKRLVSQADAA